MWGLGTGTARTLMKSALPAAALCWGLISNKRFVVLSLDHRPLLNFLFCLGWEEGKKSCAHLLAEDLVTLSRGFNLILRKSAISLSSSCSL